MSIVLRLPEKKDYSKIIKILKKSPNSKEYHQLVEASASAYFETKGPAKWLFMKRFQVAKEFLEKIGPVKQLLDAGTGIGFFLPTLSQAANQVTGFDYAKHTLRYAQMMCKKLRIKNVSFVQGDLTKLLLKKNQFDVIVTLSVLEHIPPKKLAIVMKHFKRVLMPEGYLIAGYPNEGSWLFKLIQQMERIIMRPKIFKSLKNEDRNYKPLGHVANLKEIDEAIKKEFEVVEYLSLPGKLFKLYGLSLNRVNQSMTASI